MHSFRSNADHTRLISKSIFITNFPDSTTSKDLWNLCQPYGTVVDVFIPNRKSKSGKRFAFIRFIKVDNIDRLLLSFVSAVKGNSSPFVSKPALVLDESCLVTRDLGYFIMGEVLQFSSINNLRVILSNEGFPNAHIVYLGGLWVMIELESAKTKLNLMNHVGVASWFMSLCNAQSDFIGSKWGDVLELEDDHDDLFARKRLCIKTKHEENILESFKIIVKWKVFCVRAKELFVWNPTFKDIPEAVHCSDDESIKGEAEMNDEDSKLNNDGDASDSEVVSDTYFGDNADEQGYENEQGQSFNAKEVSKDPFNIYDLLNKTKKVVGTSGSDTSLPYPSGFTPDKSTNVINKKEGGTSGDKPKEGGSILEILDEMIKLGQTMGFSMEGCTKDIENIIGSKGVEALGNSGGILCTWDSSIFHKEHHIISDNFVALYGTWIPNQLKLLVISVYAPQSLSSKQMLWSYISSLIMHWNGESLVMGDFNELEGYAFTWAHPSASKMSKLDRFLVSDGLISFFPHISAICLDRHLSDHRPILLRECISDFGAIPFRFYHSWFGLPGFDQMVIDSWNSLVLDDNNGMIRFKKKLQLLKKKIRGWVMDYKRQQVGRVNDLKAKLSVIDKELDQGRVSSDDLLLSRMESMKLLHDFQSSINRDNIQKAKIRWAIEGDENSKFFHAIINKKRANLSVKGVMVDGEWMDDPSRVKEEFHNHFATRFQDPGANRGNINFTFPNRLSLDQVSDLESPISRDEIRLAVWGCGEDKSPGPDGFTFEFFRKFWKVVGPDFCIAVEWFFEHGSFAIGCNSSFVALIPKILDPKIVISFPSQPADPRWSFYP
ncbi:RNA-directed DNA polymerase, eukaryota [Tanacetum coccineum]